MSALDHGLLVGDAAFETCKVVRGTVFAWRRHLLRLVQAADSLGLRLPGEARLHEACRAVIDAAGLGGVDAGPGRLRLTVTSGPGPLGSARGEGPPTVIAHAAPLAPFSPTTSVVTVPWVRNERSAVAGLKTTSYAEGVVVLAHARQRGADEGILANTRGELCEGAASNVFLVVDGRLLTPPLASGCLAGISRELVCELVEVDERPVPLGALAEAEEAFLTSSTRGVHPIAAVDGRPLPRCPGPRTEAAQRALEALEATTLDP